MTNEQTLPAVAGPLDRRVRRLLRKLEKRDARIAALERRMASLERALAAKDLDSDGQPRDITRAVQAALCNIRMIPIIGHANARIIDVKSSTA